MKTSWDNSNEKKIRLGTMGERVVGNYFSQRGSCVVYPIDPYDSTKDMTIDGEKTEVKTQIPFINERAMTIDSSQLAKCRNVSQLYFVTLQSPQPRFIDSTTQGWVFSVDPTRFNAIVHTTTKSSMSRLLIKFDDPAVTRLFQVDPQDLITMMKYNTGN